MGKRNLRICLFLIFFWIMASWTGISNDQKIQLRQQNPRLKEGIDKKLRNKQPKRHTLGDGVIVAWNLFLGSESVDNIGRIFVDKDCNLYITGDSQNNWGSPIRPFSGNTSNYDAFVAKLDSSGNLIWNTFLGSLYEDHGCGIALDSIGNIYVAGSSSASWGFPVQSFSGDGDIFIAKLDRNGNLIWNSFLGATGLNYGTRIALDNNDNIYISGLSTSSWGSPIRAYSGSGYLDYDACVAKLDSSGNLIWNTFLGTTKNDYCNGMSMDKSGNIYVTGESHLNWGDPIRSFSGASNAFVAKLDNNGNLIWNTFLGSSTDYGIDISFDGNNNVIYVTGESWASWGSPISAYLGFCDAFVAKLDNNGRLIWNTFVGSNNIDSSAAIAVDKNANIYLTGSSYTSLADPVTNRYNSAAFVAELEDNGKLLWNIFLRGPTNENDYLDIGNGISVYGCGTLFVIGSSTTAWGPGAYTFPGHRDGFVAKLIVQIILQLQAQRLEERAWIIRKQYGKIQLTIDNPGDVPVAKYVIYRSVAGGGYMIIKEIMPSEIQGDQYTYLDEFLEKNKTYTYRVEALDASGLVLAISNEVTI